ADNPFRSTSPSKAPRDSANLQPAPSEAAPVEKRVSTSTFSNIIRDVESQLPLVVTESEAQKNDIIAASPNHQRRASQMEKELLMEFDRRSSQIRESITGKPLAVVGSIDNLLLSDTNVQENFQLSNALQSDSIEEIMQISGKRKESDSSIRTIVKPKSATQQLEAIITDEQFSAHNSPITRKITRVTSKVQSPTIAAIAKHLDIAAVKTDFAIEPIQAAVEEPVEEPEEKRVSVVPAPAPKKERPKTKLEELKSMTDQVAQRRKDIASVMFSDRDYILGVMDAYQAVDAANFDDDDSVQLPSQPLSRDDHVANVEINYLDPKTKVDTIFGTEIDRVLSSLDKTVTSHVGPLELTRQELPSFRMAMPLGRPLSSVSSVNEAPAPPKLDPVSRRIENTSSATIDPRGANQPAKKTTSSFLASNTDLTSPEMARMTPDNVSTPVNDQKILSPATKLAPTSPNPGVLNRAVKKAAEKERKAAAEERKGTVKKNNGVSELMTVLNTSRPYDPTTSVQAAAIAGSEDVGDNSFISTTRLGPWMKPHKTFHLLLIPLNAMFDMRAIDMSVSHRFGRNNTTNHPSFKGFGTLVVSRNHVDLFESGGKIYIKDIGSNSGTFRNNARLSPPGQVSPDVELLTGDYVQLGKDFTDDTALDECGRIPGQNAAEAIQRQPIPIEKPVNRSESGGRDDSFFQPNSSPTKEEKSLPVESSVTESSVPAHILPPNMHTRDSTKFETPPQVPGKDSPHQSGPPPLPAKESKPIRTIMSSKPNVETQHPNEAALERLAQNLNNEIVPNPSDSPTTLSTVREHFKQKAILEQFVISYNVAGGKVTKLQVNMANGAVAMEVNLKRWEDKS
ncbi:hypothetical protein HDU91_000489, partial [Kappamyces sp. JEL0680]